ncbi:MAG: MlaE family ABC transporter permease [Variibacter sp.]
MTPSLDHIANRLAASGSWTASYLEDLQRIVGTAATQPGLSQIDVGGIGELDTFGAWILESLRRRCGPDVMFADVPAQFQGLFDALSRVQCTPEEKPIIGNSVSRFLERVGRATESAAADFIAIIAMLGALGEALFRILLKPRRLRLTSSVHQLDRVAWQATPIILLITFLIGCIIAQQGIFHFRKFGADDYVVDLVGILILREIGVLLVAIMVAGRSGSSYTAEIGSMKMREEIDALRTMGLDPTEVLLLPRVIALVIALPFLTFIGSIAALYGGGLVAWLYGGMSPEIFIARLKEAISLDHFKVGIIKAPFMALMIGVVACVEGLKVKGSAESLGLQTTSSVVKSIFIVIVLDGLFAIFFASIGM